MGFESEMMGGVGAKSFGIGGFGLGGFDMIIPIIVTVLIIYVIVKLVQGNSISFNTRKNGNDALYILNQRYAKGEISDEEYMQKKNTLMD